MPKFLTAELQKRFLTAAKGATMIEPQFKRATGSARRCPA
jgi:hypothetical protein